MRDYLKSLFAARGAAFWLNLLGLSLAFVIFYVLMAEVMWHVTFDHFHKDADRVCQVFWKKANPDGFDRLKNPNEIETGNLSAAVVEEILRSTQAFETAVSFSGHNGKTYLTTTDDEVADSVISPHILATEELFKVFSFDFIEGDASAFRDEKGVFIPLNLAKKLYGEQESYVGRRCGVRGQWEASVVGVYRDFPNNSQMGNAVYQRFSDEQQERYWRNEHWVIQLFVKLREGADSEQVSAELLANSASLREKAAHFTFIPVHEVYFTSVDEGIWDGTPFRRHGGSYTLVGLLAVVAALVIFIAAINHVNFSMAMVSYQIKNINVRRILGEQAWSIQYKLLWTTFINTTVAAALALLLLTLLIQNGWIDEWLKCDLAFSHNGFTLLMLFLLTVLLSLVAGGYPAWYVTSRKPALVVNGSFALSPAGRASRWMLIGFQFSGSLCVIIVMAMVLAQNHYMYTAPVGYARDSVLYITPKEVWTLDMNAYYDPLTNGLKSHPAVKEVSWANYRLGEDNRSGWGTYYEGQPVRLKGFPVKHNFLTAMGIRITEGRNFCSEDEGKRYMICNETARKRFGLKLNTYLFGEIIGFCEDIKYGSFKKEVEPMAFALGQGWGGNCIVRLTSPDRKTEVSRFADNVFGKVSDGAFEWETSSSSSIADQTYVEEITQLKLLMLVSVISLVIPLIGVFGLVFFETQAKRKEIGIRKVFGATTRGILGMFNMQYLRMLAVCFVFAAPVAYTLYNKWIESFAYRAPMHWWLFGVAFLIVAFVVCLTVTIQSWRAAKERPVETIMK